MSWNYRVVRRVFKCKDPAQTEEVQFCIHEVYYDENGKQNGMTVDDVAAYGHSLDGLRHCLQLMLAACDKEILEYKE